MAPNGTEYALTREYYDRNADVIVAVLGRHFNAALVSRSAELPTCLDDDLRYTVETAGLEPGQAVLECGSGNGLFARRLLERVPGLRYAGVDISARQVAAARRLNPGVDFREASFEELEFPDGSFDRALFLETVGYCIDFDRLLGTLRRVLKPGGRVFIKNPGQRISDYQDYVAYSRWFDPVRKEYGFHERSVGIIPDLEFVARKFALHGFALRDEEYPFYNDYFYNASFYQSGICRQLRMADKHAAAFDFEKFDPERSLSDLGRNHPEYVNYHRRMRAGTGYTPANWMTGCAVMVFQKERA